MIFLEYIGSIEHPETVYAGISHNSVASGGAVIGSHHLKTHTEARGIQKSDFCTGLQ